MHYSFSGHQTFPFRYAWLPKGVSAVKEDPAVFASPDALVRLGVGRNMVASIRHWGEALELFETTRGKSRVLRLGTVLFGGQDTDTTSESASRAESRQERVREPNGSGSAEDPNEHPLAPEKVNDGFDAGEPREAADPYLEDPGTLWLLHWRLIYKPAPASTWHLVFTRFAESVFTRDELVQWLLRCAEAGGNRRASRASIRRDLDVFIRTYLPARDHVRRPLEDTFDCPLAELGLLEKVDAGRFALRRGRRPSLPVEILAFAVLEFWQRVASNQQTLALERVLFDPGSPGAAFKLSDRDLVGMLEELPAYCGVRYDETAGMRLLMRESECDPFEILERYYEGAYL